MSCYTGNASEWGDVSFNQPEDLTRCTTHHVQLKEVLVHLSDWLAVTTMSFT